MELVELSRGRRFVLYAPRESGDALSGIESFLNGMPSADADRIIAVLDRVAEVGPPRNVEKSRVIKGSRGLFELKSGPWRLFYFYWGERGLVITHGFRKRGQKTPAVEIERAERWRRRVEAEWSRPRRQE
jgi:phage-related protein